MTFNSCLNFKLSECIGVFGYYIWGMIDCNEWKKEKSHKLTNMGKVKRLKLCWQPYLTSLPERDIRDIRPLDFCWTVYNCLVSYHSWFEAVNFNLHSFFFNDSCHLCYWDLFTHLTFFLFLNINKRWFVSHDNMVWHWLSNIFEWWTKYLNHS
jgi:hypothetical protein